MFPGSFVRKYILENPPNFSQEKTKLDGGWFGPSGATGRES